MNELLIRSMVEPVDSSIYKVDLLKEFYSTMRRDMLKWEVKQWGIDWLEMIEKSGAKIEYGELTNGIPKYKITNIPGKYFDYMLKTHTEQDANVCIYYNNKENTVLSFNLDDNNKKGNEILNELKAAVCIITEYLKILDIEPLVIVSGRGYHIILRFSHPIDNDKLSDFILLIEIWNKLIFKETNHDINKINVCSYPNKFDNTTHSLRLFGSKHIKNQVFSYVCSPKLGVLGEKESWEYFEYYMNHKTISLKHFEQVYNDEFLKIKKQGKT